MTPQERHPEAYKLIEELRQYERHLRTWTTDSVEFGAVRSLRQLLGDAAARLEKRHTERVGK
jgi:hypothetical protein